jgi:plasmid stabilization system protein ParE
MKIIWSLEAKKSLHDIYLYHLQFSKSSALKLKKLILNAPKTIVFSKQYQIDEINSKYRRLIVKQYKLIYLEVNNAIWILDIVCSLQSPEILKNK